MRTLTLLAVTLFLTGAAQGQHKTKKMNEMPSTEKWFKSGEYLNGLAIRPAESVNQKEFYRQYSNHADRWNAAFRFLKETDLTKLATGKHAILEDEVFASVTEGPNKSFEDAKWEYHKAYADIQYVISGEETMGVAPVGELIPEAPYNPAKDICKGSVTGGKFYKMDHTSFQIFFPCDAHKPSVAVDGFPVAKKIVIKVKCD